MWEAGRTFGWTAKRSRETAPGIHLHQQLLDAYQRQRPFNSATKLYEAGWKGQGIALFQVQPVLANGRERIARQSPFSLLGHLVKGPLEMGDEVVGRLGEVQLGVGQVPLMHPACGIIDEIGK